VRPDTLPGLERPCHVLAHYADRHSLCGVKDPLPLILAKFVQDHVEGHGMVVCPACAEKMGA